MSIITMWMLAHKLMEQWWLWFVVNIISCGLLFGKDCILRRYCLQCIR
ncbi:MAG: nicotinamide mononucleotide transporter family protein [Dysgonamonadaceae bacterium]|nr:nicotinamide mononucleotide transporter family protein [Dysgonamonadaceae bacterium]